MGQSSDLPSSGTITHNIKQERRRKLHYCHWRPHSYRPFQMLTSAEFGFERIDLMAASEKDENERLDDFDIIFGGYPHCGAQRWDWNMTSGLNAKLEKRGWDKFKPHQIWFPCMGCASSFCNKRDLCRVQSALDPSSCFVLPDHKNELIASAQKHPDKLWVVKRDAADLHLHAGTGVQVIRSMDELPGDDKLVDGTYLVQPYMEPLLGSGKYQRKSEIKIYLALASVTPLRIYAYADLWASFSPSLYLVNGTEEQQKCMHDSHSRVRACASIADKSLSDKEKAIGIKDYTEKVQISQEVITSFKEEALTLLGEIFRRTSTVMKNHKVNRGIDKSGASCFSFMRADFGISAEGKPSLYEINEFPFANQKYAAGQIQERAYRDLFNMIGISEPPIEKNDRAEYEGKHLGGWILL